MKKNRLVALASMAMMASAGLLVGAPQAQAIDAATGACTDGASHADFSAWYTVDGNNRFVNYHEALLTNANRIGDKNNVYIESKQSRTGPDKVLKSWRSGDNVKGNKNARYSGAAGTTTPKKKGYSHFEFVFDNSGPDDRCDDETSTY